MALSKYLNAISLPCYGVCSTGLSNTTRGEAVEAGARSPWTPRTHAKHPKHRSSRFSHKVRNLAVASEFLQAASIGTESLLPFLSDAQDDLSDMLAGFQVFVHEGGGVQPESLVNARLDCISLKP